MMEERCNCRIQSADGVVYELLQSGQCGFLMVQKDDGKPEYVIALEPKRQSDDIYHWEQARYFKSKEAAEKAFGALEKHIAKEGRTVFTCQSVCVMREVAKKLACGSTAIDICRRYGREALLNTMAGIALSRPRLAKEVKAWAAKRTSEVLMVGDMPTNNQIVKAWKDAHDMRLF